MASTSEAWPALPLAKWQDTYATLHMWTQIVGKVCLELAPAVNHWWGITFRVTPTGLTSPLLPYGGYGLGYGGYGLGYGGYGLGGYGGYGLGLGYGGYGGESRNVVPTEISVHIDGRLLPGQQPDEFLEELRSVIDLDVELEVVAYDEGTAEVDYGLFDVLSGILAELDPGATPIPMLLPAVTDGRFFSRLGIQTYGFLPLRLEPDFSFIETIHAADERVPVDALEFGTRAISELLRRYGTEQGA